MQRWTRILGILSCLVFLYCVLRYRSDEAIAATIVGRVVPGVVDIALLAALTFGHRVQPIRAVASFVWLAAYPVLLCMYAYAINGDYVGTASMLVMAAANTVLVTRFWGKSRQDSVRHKEV